LIYDTLGLEMDTLRYWYRQIGTIETYRALAESYIAEEDSLNAVEVLDSIPILFDLTPSDSIEHEYFRELKLIQYEMLVENVPPLEPDSLTRARLENIADNSEGLSGLETQGYLNAVYQNNHYKLIPQLPEGNLGERSAKGSKKSSNQKNKPIVNAYPNPSTGEFTFHYLLPGDVKEVLFFIADAKGRLLHRKILTEEEGAFTWMPEKGTEGILIFKVFSSGRYYQIGKLIIIR
jgi:hypothetical protein